MFSTCFEKNIRVKRIEILLFFDIDKSLYPRTSVLGLQFHRIFI